MRQYKYRWYFITQVAINWDFRKEYKHDDLTFIVSKESPEIKKLSMLIWYTLAPARDQFILWDIDFLWEGSLTHCKTIIDLEGYKISDNL